MTSFAAVIVLHHGSFALRGKSDVRFKDTSGSFRVVVTEGGGEESEEKKDDEGEMKDG